MENISEIFLDYINGKLSIESEQEMFTSLSSDDLLRNEFRSFVAIDKSLKSSAESFIPSAAATNSIFASLGLQQIPVVAPVQPLIPVVPFYKSALFAGLSSGLVVAAGAVAVILLLFTPKNANNLIDTIFRE